MRTDIAVTLDYATYNPVTVLMQIAAQSGDGQNVESQQMILDPNYQHREISGDAGIGTRSFINVTEGLKVHYTTTVTVTRPIPDWQNLVNAALYDLPAEVVPYLMSSRYCPADQFVDFLGTNFAGLTGGALIVAMSNWIVQNMTYDGSASNGQTTAIDSFYARRGVCRDYAHLLISLARASAIPARIVSVYGPDVQPADFHAVAEIWMNGDWHMIDPTGMSTADRLVRIGVGHDAADVAFLTAYGQLELRNQAVRVSERH